MRVILASNNRHKLEEIRAILLPLGYEVVSQAQAGITLEVEETGTTFEANALLKARAIYELCHEPVVADDSGLEVDYLNKAPGVYSNRYAGENATDTDRCNKILRELDGVPDVKRTARFVCVIQFIDKNGCVQTARGECAGRIGTEMKGQNGFGYDPIFWVGEKSFAEILPEEKNKISHRAAALRKLTEIITKM